MLSEAKLNVLEQWVKDASNEEIIWASGYLKGFLDKNSLSISTYVGNDSTISIKPSLIYATETGNSKKAALQLAGTFKKNKIQSKNIEAFQYDLNKLEKETLVFFIVSTQGEGEFPQNATEFFTNLQQLNADLTSLKYAIFGLGDSSYPLFCNAAIDLDECLKSKGAQSIFPLVKADVDYTPELQNWEQDLLKYLQNKSSSNAIAENNSSTEKSNHKKHYIGKIMHKVVLNDRGSNKETYHIEIESEDEIHYQPGDALGIVPENKIENIEEIISFFNENPEREISISNHTHSIEYFLKHRSIKALSKKSVEKLFQLFEVNIEPKKLNLIEVLLQVGNPKSIKIEQVIELLLPIAPRLYSISSSREAHDGQVHLTVNLHRFTYEEINKKGLASEFLADYPLHTEFKFYIHKNPNFRLPSPNSDIILIGPGTGIAPFRSFLAERDVEGADGKNWLFFGEQHFTLDFYYQTEIQEWISNGVLTHFDAAFSRDQQEKIYVQDRIKEKATEFNEWIENGAYIYVCGQKNPMSIDVENAIIEAIASQRNITTENAKEILEQLETEGKYLKDVY